VLLPFVALGARPWQDEVQENGVLEECSPNVLDLLEISSILAGLEDSAVAQRGSWACCCWVSSSANEPIEDESTMLGEGDSVIFKAGDDDGLVQTEWDLGTKPELSNSIVSRKARDAAVEKNDQQSEIKNSSKLQLTSFGRPFA
jgi:hypothetical protein